MSRISFMTANYVARQLGYEMTKGWGEGDSATNTYFQPLATFRERFDEMLAEVRAMEFGAIDLWTAHLNPAWATPEHIAIAVELLHHHQLRVVSLAGWSGATASELEASCRLAVALGVKILGGGTGLLTADRAATVALLKKHQLKLAIENHPEKNPGEMLAKIGDGGEGTIGTAIDTGWYGTQGYDAVDAIKQLGNSIFHVHLKDVRAPGGHDTCRYGRGCVPIGACVQTLEAIGYRGDYSIEHEPEHSDPTADCKLGRALLRVWLGENKLPAGAKPLGVAIVGCGNIAAAYAENLATYPEVRLVGFADTDAARAKSFAGKYGGLAYASLTALLQDQSIDLVVNLTIHHAHKDVITECLQAGKHVHSEKPLALTAADAQGLVALARAKGLRLGCCPATFMGEAAQTVWKQIRDGKLGAVRVAYAEVNWGRIEDWHPAPGPFYQVGALFDVGVYPLTILTTIFGPARRVLACGKVIHPDRVTAAGIPFHIDTPDFAVAVIELANGTVVRLTTNFYVPQTSKQAGIEFHGDLGSLSMSSWQNFDAKVEFSKYSEPYAPLPLVKPPYPGNEWGRPVLDMAKAIEKGSPQRATGEQAAHVVEILCATVESIQTGRPVAITSSFKAPAPMDWAV